MLTRYFRRRGIGLGSGAVLAPTAPVLLWSAEDLLTADFDNAFVWDAGSIDASNYDEIELQIDDNSSFSSPDPYTNTVDAAELLAGDVAFAPGLGEGTWYARVRHKHYVAGVAQTSDWSNIETFTIAIDNWLAPNGTDFWLQPSGTDRWLTAA